MDEQEKKELEKLVEKAVRKSNQKNTLFRTVLVILLAAAVFFTCSQYFADKKGQNTDVNPVEDHQETFENHGIFGYKAADFQDVVLGRSKQEEKLIVENQEASIPTTITDAGLFNLNITTKVQNITLYGTGEYTIDLSEVSDADVTLNEDTFTVTIAVPYPELNSVFFDSEKTVIGDTERGWLAFGSIKLDAEETKKFETDAQNRLKEELSKQPHFDEAVRFAKLSAYEVYQPVVSAVSPAYKVEIVVKDKA